MPSTTFTGWWPRRWTSERRLFGGAADHRFDPIQFLERNVAGDAVAFRRAMLGRRGRIADGAHFARATGRKRTSGRHIAHAGQIALQNDALLLEIRVRHRYRR